MDNNKIMALHKVAVVGATDNQEKYGYIILRFLQKNTGYELFPVNPNLHRDELLGLKVYPTLRDVPGKIDMAISVVPPRITSKVLQEAIELKIPHFWCQPGASTAEVEQIANGKIDLVREQCIMVTLR